MMNSSEQTKKQKRKAEIARLERRVAELDAQLAINYHFAGQHLKNLTTEKLAGSGVIVRMNFIGGKEACPPFMLKDGLSKETVAAIKADLKRSFDLATAFKPLD